MGGLEVGTGTMRPTIELAEEGKNDTLGVQVPLRLRLQTCVPELPLA